MSLYLGPIHHWVYKKILLQEDLNDQILSWNEENSILPKLRLETDEAAGTVAKGELADIIDPTNIHGWLQNQVNTTERRYAHMVTALLDQNEKNLDAIKGILYNAGKNNTEVRGKSPEEIFRSFSNLLLDGMPCDRAVTLVSADANRGVVVINNNVHQPYWEDFNYGVSLYNEMRHAWMQGFLSTTDFSINVLSDLRYEINKNKDIIQEEDTIALLMEEHTNILQMGKVVRAMSLKALQEKKIDTGDLSLVTEFIGEYADRLHHAKEEKILFRYMMDELGKVAETLVRQGMLVEHDLARLHNSNLKENIARYQNRESDETLLNVIVEAMGWVNLLGRHIDKEDQAVYPFAKRSLSKETLKKVNEESSQYTREGDNPADTKRYLSNLRMLTKKYCGESESILKS